MKLSELKSLIQEVIEESYNVEESNVEFEDLPQEVKSIFDTIDYDADPYLEIQRCLELAEDIGWTFDYDLAGEPFDFHKSNNIEEATAKDKKRIQDLIDMYELDDDESRDPNVDPAYRRRNPLKSNRAKAMNAADKQALSIKDPKKAWARYEAAKELGSDRFSSPFFERAVELEHPEAIAQKEAANERQKELRKIRTDKAFERTTPVTDMFIKALNKKYDWDLEAVKDNDYSGTALVKMSNPAKNTYDSDFKVHTSYSGYSPNDGVSILNTPKSKLGEKFNDIKLKAKRFEKRYGNDFDIQLVANDYNIIFKVKDRKEGK